MRLIIKDKIRQPAKCAPSGIGDSRSCGAKREETTQSGSRSMSSKQRMNARASKERLKAMRSAVEF